MKQEPKITYVTKYRDYFINEHEDGSFTVMTMIYPTFEKAKAAIDMFHLIKKF